MSTSAPSPREPAKQHCTNRWLNYIGEENATFPAANLPVESQPVKSRSPVDLDRLERLIEDLEARSMALVRHAQAQSPQPSRLVSNKNVIICGLALWLSVLCLFVAYVSNEKQPVERGSLPGKRVISPLIPTQQPKVAGSFPRLAKASLSSSRKRQQAAATSRPSGPSPDAATTSSTISPTETSLHDPSGAPQIQPSDLAIPHKTTEGIVDYWLMPRGPHDSPPARVFSVGKVAAGVVVLNLEDDRYYTVTPAGGWRELRISSSAN
jgi:hypothetical protein